MNTLLQWLMDSHVLNIQLAGWVWAAVVPLGILAVAFIVFFLAAMVVGKLVEEVIRGLFRTRW